MAGRLKKTLSMLLCAVLLLSIIPVRADAITLTVVNDSLLPLSGSTMPARLGGELYVPYSVFTSFGISATYQDDALMLSTGDVALVFSLSEGYVYDQNLTSYASPAYSRNGTIYVPVKLCCGKFGLGYSTFSYAGETVLRITDGSAQSDSAFTSSAGSRIEQAIDAYYGYTPPTPGGDGGGQTAPEPDIPPVEETPSQKPSNVYFTFFGAPTGYTSRILDTLASAGHTAAFFLPTDSSTWTDDLVRRIVAQGHIPGLLLTPTAQDTPESLVSSLTAANERLTLLTGVSTRFVSCTGGCSKLSEAQRDAITAAGYRLWDATYDSGDATQSANRCYAMTANYFTTTSSTVVLGLHHSASTASAVSLISSYLSRQGVPVSRITLATTPINTASDTR